MRDNESERSEKLRDEYFSLLNKVINLHEKITKIHGHLWSALELDHELNKSDIEQAKEVARQFDQKFPEGIEYAIDHHVSRVKELDEEIFADTFDPSDNGVKNSDFGGVNINIT